MKPTGIILTYMRWCEWRWLAFNVALLLWQIVFLVMGTVYGKIKVDKKISLIEKIISIMIISFSILGILFGVLILPYLICGLFGIASLRGIDWRRVWRAAQVCHVRLVLQKRLRFDEWLCVNFGWPKAELQPWRERWNDGKRFAYRDPTFDPSPEFITAMIEYAYAQVYKPYDVPQLASYALNLAIWIVCPWTWGREVIKWFNKPGGHESCSSGVMACLRWAYLIRYGYSATSANKMLSEGYAEYGTIFFERYDTAMVPPCLVPLSKNWNDG